MFLRPFGSKMSRAVNPHLSGSNLQASVSSQWAVSEHSDSTRRTLGEHLQSTQRAHSREQAESTQGIQIRVNTVGALNTASC